jgi:hypothetical protein
LLILRRAHGARAYAQTHACRVTPEIAEFRYPARPCSPLESGFMVLGPSIADRAHEEDPVSGDVRRRWEAIVASPVVRALATLACLAAGAVAMVLRRVDAVSDPKLWAEDGPIFLFGSFVYGKHSILRSYAGYLHLIPRLWALLSTLVPVRDLALSYVWFAIVFNVMCCGVVLTKRLEWLIGSPILRAAVFFCLVLLPGTSEIYGSLTNSILLSLCRQPRTAPGRFAEYSACLALGLTGVASAAVAPAFLFRWHRERSRFNLLLALTVGAAGLLQCALALTSGRVTQHAALNLGSVPRAIGFRPFATLMFGEEDYLRLVAKPLTPTVMIAVAGFAAAFIYSAFLLPLRSGVAVLSVPLMSFALVFVGQGGTLDFANGYAGGRYFLYPMVCIILVASGAASHLLASGRLARAATAGAVLLVPFVGIISDGALPAYRTIHWEKSASCIASHRQCHVILNPPGWFVDLPPLSTARR